MDPLPHCPQGFSYDLSVSDASQSEPTHSLGKAALLLLHHMYDFIVQTMRSIQPPDEIYVCPFRNVLMVDEVVHFGEQCFHIIWIWKPVLTSSPHCYRDRHVSNFVLYRSWLEKEKLLAVDHIWTSKLIIYIPNKHSKYVLWWKKMHRHQSQADLHLEFLFQHLPEGKITEPRFLYLWNGDICNHVLG